MRRFVSTSVVALTLYSTAAFAACTPPFMTAGQIKTLLANNTACIGHTPTAEWSEWHNGGSTGTLVDWKKGASDPVDPTTTVGTYAITSSITAGIVNYTYGTNSYNYYVSAGSANPYTFCNVAGAPSFSVTVNPGQGPC